MGPIIGAPVALGRRIQTMKPVVSMSTDGGSWRVRHRELVLPTVAGSTTFTVQNTLNLNPGLSATFPWLAPQAQQWEQYICHKLRSCWVPIAGSNTAGDIGMSPDYDSSDPAPTTETQASDNVDTVVDVCWRDICCDLNPRSMMNPGPRKFVRPCAVAGDIKTFDVGKLFIWSNNEVGTANVGKVWLEYDFEFFVPQNSPAPSTTPLYVSALQVASSNQTFTTATPAVVKFDTALYDPLNTFVGASNGTLTPPAGVYRLDYSGSFTDSSSETFTTVVGILKNGTLFQNLQQSTVGAAVAGQQQCLSLRGVVPCNGTDTISIQASLTGAAGTLIANRYEQVLLLSLA